jgi:hypothetical protein
VVGHNVVRHLIRRSYLYIASLPTCKVVYLIIRGADSGSEVGGDNYGERSEPKKFFCSGG